MKLRRPTLAVAALLGAVMFLAGIRPAFAQTESRSKSLTLWVDSKTGQLFTRPGKGRKAFIIPSAGIDTSAIESRVEEKVEQKTQALEQNQQEIKADLVKTQQQNQEVSQQMAEIRPAWKDYIDNFRNKFRVGTLVYADWRLYTHTGFGPQELTQINAPGPGNNIYNSFDISRTYLNLYFNPTPDWTVRVTPNIYRTQGTSALKFGSGKNPGFVGTDLGGDLGFRLKYAYLQYGRAFDQVEPLKGDTITIGQIPNPLVGWEEDLYGYRYVNLVPWNYLSLSSTQQGISVQGPVKFGGVQYIDYDLGAYNNGSFHTFEQTNTKQGMVRATVYPLGAMWRFDGLGLTGFYSYGYSNVSPDTNDHIKQAHLTRIAALVHYTTELWGVAGEFDYGHNAFSAGNLFSGSGPADAFGGSTKTFGPYTAMTTAFQGDGKSVQEGFDFLGHLHLPGTPFTAFGTFEWFEPNSKVDVNPNDFMRWIAGISYQYNEFLRFALASQNLLYYHSQFNVAGSEVKKFGGSAMSVTDAVPRDNHMFFFGTEFSY